MKTPDHINLELHSRLADIFGEERVSYRDADRRVYARDQWVRTGLELRGGAEFAGPDFVVWPDTTEQLSRLMSLANQMRFPVVPVGGGAGSAGGAAAAPGSVVVDMKRFHRVLDVSETNRIAVVEVGIIGEHLERRLNTMGYTLGHFPGSMYTSTIGGYLAARSAGHLVSRYGRIEDTVVSLLAVLPDGSLYRSRTVPRSATGPDLDQVLLGSEGTLAILVQAKLRVHKLPERICMRAFQLPSIEQGVAAMRKILHTGIRPSTLRLYDEANTRSMRKSMDLTKTTGCLMLAATEGVAAMAELEMEIAEGVCEAIGAKNLGEEPARLWWESRYAIHYVQGAELTKPGRVADSVAVVTTWSNLLNLYIAVSESLSGIVEFKTRFAHAYRDGCSIIFAFTGNAKGGNAKDGDAIDIYDRAWERAMAACLKAGGSIAHHRGIGLHRAKWLPEELGAGYRILRELKRTLDPANILNPGKLGLSAPVPESDR